MLRKRTITHSAFTLLIAIIAFLSLAFLLKPATVGASRPGLPAHDLTTQPTPPPPPSGAIIVDDGDPGFVCANPSAGWSFSTDPSYYPPSSPREHPAR